MPNYANILCNGLGGKKSFVESKDSLHVSKYPCCCKEKGHHSGGVWFMGHCLNSHNGHVWFMGHFLNPHNGHFWFMGHFFESFEWTLQLPVE